MALRSLLGRLLLRFLERAPKTILPTDLSLRAINRLGRRLDLADVRRELLELFERPPDSRFARSAIELLRAGLAADDAVALASTAAVITGFPASGTDLRLEARSAAELSRRFAFTKEPWTTTWIRHDVRQGDVFFDIGANVGAYSLLAAACTAGQARIFAFEPAFENYSALCRNIRLNAFEACIVPIPLALAARTGLDHFNYNTNVGAGSALHTLGEARDQRGELFHPVYRQPVAVVSLDDFVSSFGCPSPVHMKIDVDGTELDVLVGARKVLANPALRSIMIESSGRRTPTKRIVDVLETAGFRLRERNDRDSGADGIPDTTYLLFGRQ